METYAEYLEHYGVKGMRWGIRRTPEQLGHKRRKDITIYGSASDDKEKSAVSKFLDSRREAAKKREQNRKEANRKKMLAERAAKARQAKAAKKEALKKAEEKAKADIKRREEYLKDPTLLLKHKDEFSTEEINKAVQRFDVEKRLQQLSMDKLSRGEAYIRTAVKYANASVDAYNIAARIVNTFGGTDFPTIPKGDKQKDKGDKEEKDQSNPQNTQNTSSDSNTNTQNASSNTNTKSSIGLGPGKTSRRKRRKKK